MEDIPMDSVITDQPVTPERLSEAEKIEDNQSSPIPKLTRLGPLQSTSKLTLKQRIRACEILSLVTGCEVEKKYNIHGESGEILYTAKESSNCFCRFFCGTIRNLDINIFDQTGRNISRLHRPLNCSGCCCHCLYPVCTQEMTVSLDGEGIGIIRERATWCYPVYHIFDSVGSPMLKIRGPFFNFGCCGDDVPFIVTRTDSSIGSEHISTITKKWGGICKEAALDADNFVIDFFAGKNVTVQEKLLILASTFLIDLMYYESDG